MKIMALLLSLLLVSACATTSGYQSASGGSEASESSEGIHWGWWLLGIVAVGLALSASGGSDDCRETPYTREDGVRVVGDLNCL